MAEHRIVLDRDPIRGLAAEWRTAHPERAQSHRPIFRLCPFTGWYIDGDTPIVPGPASLDGGYTIPGPTAAQLAHGGPLAAGGIVDRNVRLVSIGEQPCGSLVDVRPVPALAALLDETRSYSWPRVSVNPTRPSDRQPQACAEPVISPATATPRNLAHLIRRVNELLRERPPPMSRDDPIPSAEQLAQELLRLPLPLLPDERRLQPLPDWIEPQADDPDQPDPFGLRSRRP
ncbi:MAG: hypothetical protein HOV79_00265 [Hamadaea sp.]|nr:hypothetical protein [Hamadaea sp.]